MFLTPYRVADRWEEAQFYDRPNRFTLVLKLGNRRIRAYLPNTGRLEEYLVEDSPFYIVPHISDKFRYRAVSTFYQDNYVLLDTIQMNHLVGSLIGEGLLPWLKDYISIKQEKGMGSSRFDFCVERKGLPPLIIEAKTCTLAHNGIAMFPDAPTLRALSHLDHMSRLTERGFEASMLFVIPNAGARRFMPNFHTDPDFSEKVFEERRASFRAVTLKLTDPVTVDPGSLREISIDLDYAGRNRADSGSYLIVLENSIDRKIEVGSLGSRNFRKGYYVYVGSGLKSLGARLRRHRRSGKKKFWHIDYITPEHFKLRKTYAIRRPDRIEQLLVERVRSIAQAEVAGFGSSDSSASSHLFYFQTPPFRSRQFINIVLDFRTGTE
jgi:sugar fermentation stimulation protein A